jgi:hypothetical protein
VFGTDDIAIYSDAHKKGNSYTKLGEYYELPAGIEEGTD